METLVPPSSRAEKALLDAVARRWLLCVGAIWLIAAIWMVVYKWGGIHWFSLGDTDDNMRIMQVRALLHGQRWYDLRNYRMDPPYGASIHWTRLVDLPLAALILAGRLFVSGPAAERFAVAVAPMLPMWVALVALALLTRRLIAPLAFLLAGVLLFFAQSTLLMFMPLRIDHHGWQLAFLVLGLAGCVDPDQRRGGLTAGFAGAASLTIGLEMLPYIGLMTGATALRWVVDPRERERLRAYGLSLALGCLAGFAGFASYDNRALVCDVLSPVYLAVALAGGGLFAALSAVRTSRWQVRLALAVGAAALLGAGFAIAFPQCLGRPEHMSPELERLWFVNVREAKPLYTQNYRIVLAVVALPAAGLIGTALATWHAWRTERFAPWATTLLIAVASCLLLLWQTRAGPAAQLLGVIGATWLGHRLLPGLIDHRLFAVRVLGTLAVLLVISGAAVSMVIDRLPQKPSGRGTKAVTLANARCPTLPALRPIALLPKATVLTFVDLGPRLITVTHQDAIAGPYHRNGPAILDIHHAFRGTPETAREVMRRHGATLLLICPGMSESTIYRAQAPHGFYAQLARGQVPDWLVPVPLPANSPFKAWRTVDGVEGR